MFNKKNIKKYFWGIGYGLLLTAFTIYLALDTFVLSNVVKELPATDNTRRNQSENFVPQDKITISENNETSYKDDNISIALTTYREYDTQIYVADVTVSDPTFLQTALAKNSYGKNVKEKTSEMAKNVGAILAVNGDYYGAREKGYVIRNGILCRETPSDREALVMWSDGSLGIINEGEISAQTLLDEGAVNVLSFGPGLIDNGNVLVDEHDEVGQATTSNPRTAIGIVDDLHYIFVVSDGRTDESAGLSLFELANFMQQLGATCAYNLDGGGSSTMVFNGEIVNNPVNRGSKISERSVSDIVYIGY